VTQQPERSGEKVVIKDKRKINPFGRARAGGAMSAQDEQGRGSQNPDVAVGVASVPGNHGPASAEGPVDGAQAQEATDTGADADVETVDSEPVTGELVLDEPAEPAEEQAGGPAERPVSGEPAPAGFAAELESLRSELEERVGDLQRVSAEYANYRRRVERDRSLVTEQATSAVLSALLPILDDLDRARDHGDLVGPFGTMAEQLSAAVGKFGVTAFGEKGDVFDPTRHEAVAHRTSSEVTEPTCVEVMRRGYSLGERLLRPALVAVADPE
jgi:molecular chaperone GrpE